MGSSHVSIGEIEALSDVFGPKITLDRHTLPAVDMRAVAADLKAPPLISTGWYDWGLNDALATWELIKSNGAPGVRNNARLFIAPRSHNMPGYHEGMDTHAELHHPYSFPTILELP